MTEVPYQEDYGAFIEEGIKAAEDGNTRLALDLCNQLKFTEISPLVASSLAYCLACDKKLSGRPWIWLMTLSWRPVTSVDLSQYGPGFSGCWLRKKTMQAFRKGVCCQRHPLLLRKIVSLGNRRPMPFPFLQRSNPLNIFVGRIFSKVF